MYFNTQFNTWLNTWFTWAIVVTQATDINTDPSYIKATNLDMASSSSLGPVVTMAQVGISGLLSE